MGREFLCIMIAILVAGSAVAREAVPAVESPAIEREAAAIAAELRCLVCQNQSIAESNAPLAVDLRNQVREQLRAGRTRTEITSYMVERYGNFVLYRPPVNAATLLLWLGPLLLVIVGFGVLYRRVARRSAQTRSLSAEERKRAAQLLAEGEVQR